MSLCVLDGSMALAWVLPNEIDRSLETLLEAVRRDGAVVPDLWHLEVANVLVNSERRKRIAGLQRAKAFDLLGGLVIEIDHQTSSQAWSETLRLADRHHLSVYDASYLELALRRRLPIASLDKALNEAARACDVDLLN